MSLINVRNFLIPIQNKYQMGALLVIALIIAVVRLVGSGGAEPVGNRENLNLNDEIKSFLSSQQPSTLSQKERAGSAAPSADPFQNELLPDGWEDEEPKDVQAPDQAKNNKGFSDVKKALGLE
jgi:hypothetical protein